MFDVFEWLVPPRAVLFILYRPDSFSWRHEQGWQTRTQSPFMCFLGERRLGVRLRRARGVMGRTDTPHPPQPKPQSSLSPQKHINSDWVRVCKGGTVVRALASHQCGSGSNPSVDAICSWFSPLLQEAFLRVLWFSHLLKNQHFRIPIRTERPDTFEQVLMNSLMLRR